MLRVAHASNMLTSLDSYAPDDAAGISSLSIHSRKQLFYRAGLETIRAEARELAMRQLPRVRRLGCRTGAARMVEEVRNIQRNVLPNGLTILTEHMNHIRSVSMGIWVKTGSRHEDPVVNGITHFVEHMVFKGTTQ